MELSVGHQGRECVWRAIVCGRTQERCEDEVADEGAKEGGRGLSAVDAPEVWDRKQPS